MRGQKRTHSSFWLYPVTVAWIRRTARRSGLTQAAVIDAAVAYMRTAERTIGYKGRPDVDQRTEAALDRMNLKDTIDLYEDLINDPLEQIEDPSGEIFEGWI